MSFRLACIFTLCLPYFAVHGQDGRRAWAAGLDMQVYPAGLISGLRAEYSLDPIQNLNLRIAYNLARRQDFGKHDDERGGGFGGGIGYRRFGIRERLPFFAGIRVDWWELTIDWQQKVNSIQTSSSTRLGVLQPTVEFGYDWRVHESWSLIATVSVGAEINVISQGEPVGEGAILLFGLNAIFRFGQPG